jgi:hypothetical protein
LNNHIKEKKIIKDEKRANKKLNLLIITNNTRHIGITVLNLDGLKGSRKINSSRIGKIKEIFRMLSPANSSFFTGSNMN